MIPRPYCIKAIFPLRRFVTEDFSQFNHVKLNTSALNLSKLEAQQKAGTEEDFVG